MRSLRALFTISALTPIQLVHAATPDKNAILAQLRKNGACVRFLLSIFANERSVPFPLLKIGFTLTVFSVRD